MGSVSFTPLQWRLFLSLTVLLDAFILASNALLLRALALSPQLRKAEANVLVASLAVTDLAVGVVDLPFAALYVLGGEWRVGSFMCTASLSTRNSPK